MTDAERARQVDPPTFAEDVARDDLRLWWESLTYEDKWEAFLAERARQADPVGLEILTRAIAATKGIGPTDVVETADGPVSALDYPEEWFATPRELAQKILASLPAQAIEPPYDAMYDDAMLPAQPVEPGPLDVERLARAVLAWTGATPLNPSFSVTLSPREMAEAIAAEYARLSPDKQPKGTG